MDQEIILEIEKGFWNGDETYFEENVSTDAIFIFPNMRCGKQESIDGVKNNPRWEDMEASDIEFRILSSEACLLTYKANGKRKESLPYIAQITSVYRFEEGLPKLFFHQHTPDID